MPGLRQGVILLDKDGSLAGLQRAALDFDWPALQPLADEYAAEQLCGSAEEAHKILNGLARAHESTVLYALWGLLKNLSSALAVQRGLLMETENRYLESIQAAAGAGSQWTRLFRLALGADLEAAGGAPFQARGAAGLALYLETARLFEQLIPEQHRDVIATACLSIERAGYRR